MECLTCQMIAMIDKTYPRRKARFGKIDGRCLWHAWEEDGIWKCDVCGKYSPAEILSFCLEEKKFVCHECGHTKKKEASFWIWKSHLEMDCPFCTKPHAALFRQEFLGEHPWQADPFSCKDFPIWYPGGILIGEKDFGS